MIRLTAFRLLTLSSTLSFAQAVNSSDAPLDISAERARIQFELNVGESRFSKQETACYAKFAVTGCLHEMRLQRRQVNDDLRRQTVMLNDMERRKKTQLKMDRTGLKSSTQNID